MTKNDMDFSTFDAQGYRILIIDDQPANLGVIAEHLDERGFKVLIAPNGEMGLALVKQRRPHLILLDVMIPGMSGIEVCRHLKAHPQTKDIPVIFVTALQSLEDKVKGFEVGGVDYITKPVHREEVLARISSHLFLRHTQLQLERMRDELESRVEERTAELQEANQQLRAEIAERVRAEAALRESEQRYRTIFEAAPVSLWEEDISEIQDAIEELRTQGVTDFRRYVEEHPEFARRAVQMLKILDVNQATLKMFGVESKADLIDSLYKISTPKARETSKEALIAIAEGERYFEAESTYLTFQGEQIHALMTLTIPLRTEEHLSELVSLQDITERKRAEAAIHLYARRLEILREIDQAILAAQSPEATAQAALAHIQRLMPCQRVSVALLDIEAGQTLILAARSDIPMKLRSGAQMSHNTFSGIEMLRQGKVNVVQDIQSLARKTLQEEVLLEEGIRSFINIPLMTQEHLVGSLNLASSEPDFFSEEHINIAQDIASPLAIAIQQAQLFEQVRAGRKQQQALARRLVEVQESERRHLARELHDEIGQSLTGLQISLRIGARQTDSEVRQAMMQEAHALLDDLAARVEDMSLNLRPSLLDDLGLVAALLWHFDRYTAQTGVDVHFRHSGLGEYRFGSETEITAYRIIQEALTNVARHANVNEVIVWLRADAERLGIAITDMGVGFEPEAVFTAASSVGVPGMRERALLLGGTLEIESGPGCGARVLAELPVDGTLAQNFHGKNR